MTVLICVSAYLTSLVGNLQTVMQLDHFRIDVGNSLSICRASYRENVEQAFKFDTKNLTFIALFVFAAPVLIYSHVVQEYDMADKAAARKKKAFM